MRLAAALVLLFLSSAAAPLSADPLHVATTTLDLASLVEAVGGEHVEVTAFVRGGQDPHRIEARPSFVRVLSRTDLFVTVGLQLEASWVTPLVRSARNARIQRGGSGKLDASESVPLEGVLTGPVDRSMGDIHATGNPHYLLDPVNGIRVARAIRERLEALRPEQAASFRTRAESFEERMIAGLVGQEVVDRYGAKALAEAILEDRLGEVVRDTELAGWLGAMRPHRGQRVVADHDLWPYFAKRFGIQVAAFLEPLPGITPTTRHLSDVSETMRAQQIRAILSAAYFHPRYAEKVADAAGARVLEMANQVGSRREVDDYWTMIDWNVRQVASAL